MYENGIHHRITDLRPWPQIGERICCDFPGDGRYVDCELKAFGTTFFQANIKNKGCDLTIRCRFVTHSKQHAFWRMQTGVLHYQFTKGE